VLLRLEVVNKRSIVLSVRAQGSWSPSVQWPSNHIPFRDVKPEKRRGSKKFSPVATTPGNLKLSPLGVSSSIKD
jgi:hypothetical protein